MTSYLYVPLENDEKKSSKIMSRAEATVQVQGWCLRSNIVVTGGLGLGAAARVNQSAEDIYWLVSRCA